MDMFYTLVLSSLCVVLMVSSSAGVQVDCISQSTLIAELGETLKIVCAISDLDNQTFNVYWAVQQSTKVRRLYPATNRRYKESVRRINKDEARASLTISDVDIEDETKYFIELTGLNVKATVTTTIQGKPRITNVYDTIYGKAGVDLLLDCRVQSWPIPVEYKWYYQGTKVNKTDISRYQIYDRTYTDRSIAHSYLKILKFDSSHTGQYICMARNVFGEAQFRLEARVGKNESIECKVQYKCNNLQTCDLDHGCSCPSGYKEQADGRCEDIDECRLGLDNCQQDCSNIQASFECVCFDGYVMDEQNKCIEYKEPPKPVDSGTIYAIVGLVGAIVIIVGILIAVFIIRKRRKEKKSATPPPRYLFDKSITPAASIITEFSVNKVEIQHEIGKGRFGQVYLARAWDITGTGNWETVAVKQSRRDLTEEDKSAFLHELNLVKRIPYNHNIVRCLGFFYEPMMSMIFEYMSNGDLLTYLRLKRPQNFRISSTSLNKAPLTASQIFNFALQCAKGMQHLHQNKIIHRDLAARNILVANENCCKISDFGLARKVGEDYSYTSRSKRPLPILWMAPEAIFSDRTSNKSDVWSYGILFWEMITLGSRPYPGKSGPEVLEMLKNGERLHQPNHCSFEIYRILMDCWQFNPEARPEFHELVDDMEMRIDLAEEYIDLNRYDINNYNFIDHVSMSDLDLDQSEDSIRFFTRSRSRRSMKSLHNQVVL